ncbi:unnamed protein product [Coffea canephora]|uniref:peroxidase n=1 Tax=Coffea canephora TaxID=49390 RepID=A0A068VHQ7_COFCA|nr:unnamed protein product [Coffea canephora]
MEMMLKVFFLGCILHLASAQLQNGFYSTSCPRAESIVQQVVVKKFSADRSITAALLRMHFHDCFVRGCDASILIDSTKTRDPTVFLDQNTSFIVDNQFYNQIRSKRGILQIDQELALDSLSAPLASRLAANNNLFQQSFVNAMMKMGSVEVLVGNAGEIRKNCRVFNKSGGRA